MTAPKFTDKQRGGRYHNAATSREPGYLAKRMKAYARLERRRAAKAAREAERSNVTPIAKAVQPVRKKA